MPGDFTLYSYSLKGSLFFRERRGLLLSALGAHGASMWSEASPLPYRSRETLYDAGKQLLLIQQKKKLPSPLFPSVAFALEGLCPPFENVSFKTPLSALFFGSPHQILNQAKTAKGRRIFSAKIKIGHLPEREANALLMDLKSAFFLRVDCNRRWDLPEALKFFAPFSQTDFDYIEEPLNNPCDLPHFSHPFAVDESVTSFQNLPKLKALILKPTIVRNWREILTRRAQGIAGVLSSAFESGVGLSHLARQARRLHLPEPQGLGTYAFLCEDLLLKPLKIAGGFLHIPRELAIDFSKLKEIKNEQDLLSHQ